MTASGFHRSAAVYGVLILALLLQSLIPVGFMPKTGASGGLMQMEICTSSGLKHVLVSADRAPVEQSAPATDTHKQDCAYAPVLAHAFVGSFILAPVIAIAQAVTAAPHTLILSRPAKTWHAQPPPSAS